MVETYLKGRPTLRAVVLVLDVRRIPTLQEQNFIDWLVLYHRTPILVLTKADKLSRSAQEKQRHLVGVALGVEESGLILFSAKTRLGLPRVWSAIETAALEGPHERG
jgi:GTP-binding protein